MRKGIERKTLLELRRPLHLVEAAQASSAAPDPSLSAAASPALAPILADWRNDIDYDALIHNPEVRDLLAKQNRPPIT
jgi:hypothetical protein